MTKSQEEDELQEDHVAQLPQSAEELLRDVLNHRGWSVRDGQLTMVKGLEDVMSSVDGDVDITASAPVGTGKTLGYLVAVLANGGRTVVCTSTKSLQDQIYEEELPRLAQDVYDLYGYELRYSILKGRSNYPCMVQAQAVVEGREPQDDIFGLTEELGTTTDQRDRETLSVILERARTGMQSHGVLPLESGDLMNTLDRKTARAVSATRRCPIRTMRWIKSSGEDVEDEERRESVEAELENGRCAYRMAYARCMDSQIVIMNTSLLATEMKKSILAGDNSPNIMSGVQNVVVDEAHHLWRVLSQSLSMNVYFSNLRETAKEIIKQVGRKSKPAAETLSGIHELLKSTESRMFKAIDSEEIDNDYDLGIELNKLASSYATECSELLTRAMVAGAGEGSSMNKILEGMLNHFGEEVVTPVEEIGSRLAETNSKKENVYSITYVDENSRLGIETVPMDVTFFRRDLLRVSGNSNGFVEPKRADRLVAILSSGTVTKETPITVGMSSKQYIQVDSPYDSTRVRMCVPSLPPPNSDNWFEESWALVEEAIDAVGGRTMVLTTSREKMEMFTAAARSSNILSEQFNILSQSDGVPKNELLSRFRKDETSVLVGTTSFWEGVDVPGHALDLVVIDKAPFPYQGDVIFNARKEWVEMHDGNPFMQVDVEHARIMLAQGSGRLIRSVEDFGGLLVLDSRITEKLYSPAILSQLPHDWPLSNNFPAFVQWLKQINPDNDLDPFDLKIDPMVWRPVKLERKVRGRRARRN